MSKIEREKQTVLYMIRLYCRKKEGNATLCESCRELLHYALTRLEHCPYGEGKGACRHCPAHCYKPAMRERIRRVMRFAGPRMLLHAPWAALKHAMQLIR